MKHALTLAMILAAAPVAAQPAPPCAVTIARAPDDVRAVVDQWVRAEPRCTTALEVRIVPTEGGLYLLARDEHGRVRERVVPDAQSAGVLVASWVAADSSAAAPTPYDVRQPAIAAEPAAPAPAAGPEPMAAPMVAPMAPPAEALGPSAAPVSVAASVGPTPAPKWLSLGGMFAMSGTGGGGIRGELDLKTRRSWTFGAAASISTSGIAVVGGGYGEMGQMDTTDTKLLGYASVNTQKGKWHFRASFGAGVVYTQASLRQPRSYVYQQADGVFPTGEATLAVGRELVPRWMLYAAPVVTMYMQEYQIEETGGSYYYYSTERRGLDAMMMIGMRHAL